MMAKKTLEKMLSVTVVMLFITTPMAILLQNTAANQPTPPVTNSIDLVINATTVDPVTGELGKFTINENTIDPITGQRGMYGQDGNITVANGGTLIVRNATLYFLQDNGETTSVSDDHHYRLDVLPGGTLIMENSTLTTVDWAIHPYLKLPVTIQGRAELTDSTLQFPGSFVVNGGILYANNTIFKGLDNVKTGLGYDYNQDSGTWEGDSFDVDDNDDCPIMRFINSKVVFADSKVEDYYENTAVISTNNEITYHATAKWTNDTTTGQSVSSLIDEDDIFYNVSAGEQMCIAAFSPDVELPYGLSYYGEIIDAELDISWGNNDTYNGTGYIWIESEGQMYRTNVQPDATTSIYTIPLLGYGVNTIQKVRNLKVYFNHTGDSGVIPFDMIDIRVKPLYSFNITVDGGQFYAINTYFDLDFRYNQTTDRGLHDYLISKNGAVLRLYNMTVNETETTGHPNFLFEPKDNSQIYFYGWLTVRSMDGNTTDPTSVPYCRITPRYYGTNETAIKLTSENNTLHNGDPVLEYLNRVHPDRNIDESNYNKTNASGIGVIPLLKQIINATDLNGQFLGNYLVKVEENVHGTNLTQQVNFEPYPLISAESNTFTANYSFSWEYPPRDLAIWPSDVSIQPATIVRGDLVWVNATIHNIGGINVTQAFDVILMVDGVFVNGTTVTQMVERNNGTVDVSLVWQTEFGDYGAHNISVFVDAADDIPEGNESNNIVELQVFVEALYDISISPTDISWAPANPYTYQDITITATVHNTGHAEITQDFVVEFFVNGASIGTSIVTQNISSGASALASIQFNATTQDIYNISVVVDSTDVIVEDNEENNDAYRLMTMNPTPDLVVSEIDFTYPTPYADMGYDGAVEGTNVSVRASVENIGETYANGTITVDFYDGDPNIGGTLIGTASMSTNATTRLYPGNYIYLSVQWTATSPYGNHSIYAVVSFTENPGEAPETNTANNENSETITVYMRANLRFTGEYHFYDSEHNEISSIIENNTAIIEVVVENNGGYPATFDVSFYDAQQSGEGWIGNVTGVYLEPGDSTTLSIYWNPTPLAVHHITINLDPQNDVNETNETDNSMQVTLDVIGYLDLSILPADISYTPTAPLTYEVINITATVHNNGHRDINQSFVVDVMVDGQIISITTINSLPVGGTYDVSASFVRYTEGNYQVTVRVDSEDSIAETNESNNMASIVIYVGPRPEFSVGQPVVLSQYVVDNHDVTLAADVQNNGVNATGTVNVMFYDGNPDSGGVLIDTVSYTDPAQGWKATAQVTWHASGVGVHVIYVRVSASTSPPEGNTMDNTRYAPVTVLPRPDLTITNMTFFRNGEEINASAGLSICREFDINITVENIDGRLMYSGVSSFVVSFFNGPFTGGWDNLMGNLTVDNQTLIEMLDAGEPVNLTFTVESYSLGPGSANIYAVVDSPNEVDESNENNNEFNRTIEMLELQLQILVEGLPEDNTINLNRQFTLFLRGSITDRGEPVPGIKVTFELTNLDNGVSAGTWSTTSGKDGTYNLDIPLPQNPGRYELSATAQRPDGEEANLHLNPIQLSLQKPAPSTQFPFWMIIAIAGILVAVGVGGTLLMIRRKYLAKYVECGNCGRMIPAGSDKCPYCGVVFDKETVKCSVCGAWIPADAKECPKCGAKFLVSGKEIVDYETQMRKQYEEFVDRFRRQAKKEMGKDFTEEKFQQWWKSQKSYVTFEDWLKREEERKKTGGIICPHCGALNSKTDIVCHVCGSPLRPTKKKVKTEGIEEAAISKIELPSLEEEKEEKPSEEEAEETEAVPEAGEEGKEGEAEVKPAEEVKMPLAEERKETEAPRAAPVKKVVKKVVKRPVVPEERKPEGETETAPKTGEEKAPEIPEHLIAEMKKKPEGETEMPEKPSEEKPKPVVQKKVVKKVVKKKVVKK